MGPGRLRIDIIGSQRGDTAPIVDAGSDNLWQYPGAQIWRCLNIHFGTEQNSGHRNGPQQLVQVRFRGLCHQGAGLGTKVLYDNFLQVTVPLMDITQGQQGLNPLQPCFANTDEDTGGKGDFFLTGKLECRQTLRRIFVWRAVMWHALFTKTLRGRLQHNPHRN